MSPKVPISVVENDAQSVNAWRAENERVLNVGATDETGAGWNVAEHLLRGATYWVSEMVTDEMHEFGGTVKVRVEIGNEKRDFTGAGNSMLGSVARGLVDNATDWVTVVRGS